MLFRSARHAEGDWQPIFFWNHHAGPETIFPLYRAAAGCVVNSLHDGMNLVAKEFLAARSDERGVLVLSRFTGAARELPDALLVNPYDIEQLADAMYAALMMPEDEQQERMLRMRQQVFDHNIYRWGGLLLTEAVRAGTARRAALLPQTQGGGNLPLVLPAVEQPA